MQGAGSDLDGDTVTYDWDLGDGTTASGTSVSGKVFTTSGGPVTVKLTVSDGKGGSASDTRTVTVGSMTGTWLGEIEDFSRLELKLQQTGGAVTGTFTQLDSGPVTPVGTTGKTDPAEPGKIDAAGKFEVRFKVGHFLDFYLRGTMDQTGRVLTGGAFNSGFNGLAFTANKQ
jgi:hypothetical protein